MEGALARVSLASTSSVGQTRFRGMAEGRDSSADSCLQHSHSAAEDFPPLPALLSCAEMQFEGDDSRSIMGRQEKRLFFFLSGNQQGRVFHTSHAAGISSYR